MLLNSVSSINYKSQIRQHSVKKNVARESSFTIDSQNGAKIALALGGLAVIAAGGIWYKKNAFSTFAKTLEKNGLELKNNVAYIKGTDKKFTGSIQRNSKSFGKEKEITKYDNGLIQERLWYDEQGKEFEGAFYKEGNLFRTVLRYDGGIQYNEYDKDGNWIKWGRMENDASIFEEMRKKVPDCISINDVNKTTKLNGKK